MMTGSNSFTLSAEDYIALSTHADELLAAGNFQEAITTLDYLCQRNQDPKSYCRIADVFSRLGDVRNALKAYEMAIERDLRHAPAFAGAGILLYHQGEFQAAHQALAHALEIQPDLNNALNHLAKILEITNPESYIPQLERDLCCCFATSDINHESLGNLAAHQLNHKYGLGSSRWTDKSLSEHVNAIASNRLWLAYLTKCINTDPVMEHTLTILRRELLTGHADIKWLPNDFNTVVALGLQAFANEYVFSLSNAEMLILNDLTNDSSPGAILQIMYMPLQKCHNSEQLLDYLATIDNELVGTLIRKTVHDLRQEASLSQSIPGFAEENSLFIDDVSVKVRAQYEANPYPRWSIPPAPAPARFMEIIRHIPGVLNVSVLQEPLSLLVAGCGTGYEPIDMARRDPSLQITALDLSNRSLAYGLRVARELDIKNIAFRQGNILDLDKSSNRFDMVTSTGVLHHLENPEAGLCKLCSVTKAGGIMRISLYSERARHAIVQAREQIAAIKTGHSDNDIRNYRAHVFAAPQTSLLARLMDSPDFYSLSGCRDLLFHEQEHRFTLPQIATLIKKLGLRFLHLEVPDAAIQAQFLGHFSAESLTDLFKWDEFEQQYPDTFAGMYQFWCQKPL